MWPLRPCILSIRHRFLQPALARKVLGPCHMLGIPPNEALQPPRPHWCGLALPFAMAWQLLGPCPPLGGHGAIHSGLARQLPSLCFVLGDLGLHPGLVLEVMKA